MSPLAGSAAMVTLRGDSIEWRILTLATEQYPITVEALRKKLHLSKPRLERLLRQMELQGLVTVDRLPDKAYVRPTAKIAKTGKGSNRPVDPHDPSYA